MSEAPTTFEEALDAILGEMRKVARVIAQSPFVDAGRTAERPPRRCHLLPAPAAKASAIRAALAVVEMFALRRHAAIRHAALATSCLCTPSPLHSGRSQ